MSKENIKQIDRIFSSILIQVEEAEDDELKKILLNYQLILKREEDFLDRPTNPCTDLENNHPLDCAVTLQICVREFYKMRSDEENSFFEKLSHFSALASNSKFYPNAKIAGYIIATALLIFSAVMLGGLILAAPYTVPLVTYLVAAISVVASFPIYSMFINKYLGMYFQPIYTSEAQANTFFPQYNPVEKNRESSQSLFNCCS